MNEKDYLSFIPLFIFVTFTIPMLLNLSTYFSLDKDVPKIKDARNLALSSAILQTTVILLLIFLSFYFPDYNTLLIVLIAIYSILSMVDWIVYGLIINDKISQAKKTALAATALNGIFTFPYIGFLILTNPHVRLM